MQHTFRLRAAIKHQGIAFTALYLPIAMASGGLFFIQEPEKYEFPNHQSAIMLGAMGVAVFGLMSLLALYYWAAYYIERLDVRKILDALGRAASFCYSCRSRRRQRYAGQVSQVGVANMKRAILLVSFR